MIADGIHCVSCQHLYSSVRACVHLSRRVLATAAVHWYVEGYSSRASVQNIGSVQLYSFTRLVAQEVPHDLWLWLLGLVAQADMH